MRLFFLLQSQLLLLFLAKALSLCEKKFSNKLSVLCPQKGRLGLLITISYFIGKQYLIVRFLETIMYLANNPVNKHSFSLATNKEH